MYTEQELKILSQARQILASKLNSGISITTSNIAAEYFQLTIAHLEHEVFGAMFLTTQHQMIQFVELFRGTIDQASVYPREVVKEALKHNAAAIIFAHNHPSGLAEPSSADIRITLRLRDALELIDVRVLDHILVTTGETLSFADRGLL